MFSKKELQFIIHKALAAINGIAALYTMIAGMHFTFNSYNGMSTNLVALICFVAAIYAFSTALRYEKSVRYLERKNKGE